MRRHSDYQNSSQPDREDGELDRRRNTDQVSPSRVVSIRQSRRNPNDGRLTTFNALFAEPEDRFVGTGGRTKE